jgi:hypothetical protein
MPQTGFPSLRPQFSDSLLGSWYGEGSWIRDKDRNNQQVEKVNTLEPKGNVGRRVIYFWARMANSPGRSRAGT